MKPNWDEYFMAIAVVVSSRANCQRRAVGAVLVSNAKAIVSTGYTGTPTGAVDCNLGGCARCSSDAGRSLGYDRCLCVHAEENAILLAARHGTPTNITTLYSTLKPCFACLRHAIQAGVREFVFAEDHPVDEERNG